MSRISNEYREEMAAAEFATLADSLRATGVDPQRAAHFLMRLLFCLFAEDIGLLPPKLFSCGSNARAAAPPISKRVAISQCSSDYSSLDGERRAGSRGQRFSGRGFFP
jgi:hypothetical protein